MRIFFYWVLYPLIRPFYLTFLLLNTLVLALVIIMFSPFDSKGNLVHYIGKFWSLLNIYMSGARLKIRGSEKVGNTDSYIIMSNHQSLFDVWALIGKLPLQLRWIIKSDIKKIPVFGYALERMGHIYVDRKKGKGTAVGLEMATQIIKKGASAVIFPEGTRSKDGLLQRFHVGGAIMAIRSGVPILPVTVNGSRFVLPKGTLDLMPGKIEIVIGDLIDSRKFDESRKNELLAVVRSKIEQNLDLKYGELT